MKNHVRSTLEQAVRIVVIAALLFGLAVSAGAATAASTQINNGYVDFSYGIGVADEPTGVMAESKLWFNDGIWWGTLFNPTTAQYEIYRYDTVSNSWSTTGTALDTRIDDTPGEVANRFDALWDAVGSKLYLASHIKTDNAGWNNNAAKAALLFRYSYNTTTNTYTLDGDYTAGVQINTDKTEALVIDRSGDNRIWATYVSRPQSSTAYHVFANRSNTPSSGHDNWGASLDLTALDPANGNSAGFADAANVSRDDISSVIAYGTKIGVMWSNDRVLADAGLPTETRVAKFYYAEHDNASALNAGWTLQVIDLPNVTANDHIKLVAGSDGRVFAAVKTNLATAGLDRVGVLERSVAGVWSFHPASPVNSSDTHPIIVLNEVDSRLYMFVTHNEGGGLICINSASLTDLVFPEINCDESAGNASRRFIYDDNVFTDFDNPTSTKQNASVASGMLVLASDDAHGHVYGQNKLGGTAVTAPVIAGVTPLPGATFTGTVLNVTVTFSHDIDPATLNATTFQVLAPDGVTPVPGNRTYDPATDTATFTSTGLLVDGVYSATVTTGITDTAPMALEAGRSWTFNVVSDQVPTVTLTPANLATVTTAPFTVSAAFSTDMNPATLIPANFYVNGPDGLAVPVTAIAYDPATDTATITSTGLLADGLYTIYLTTGVQDADGDALAATISTFTLDLPNPTVVTFGPAAGVTVTTLPVTVSATFSADINPATLTTNTFYLTGPNGKVTGTAINYDAGTKTASFASTGFLADGAYTITLTTGVQDTGGRALAADATSSFEVDTDIGFLYLPVINSLP